MDRLYVLFLRYFQNTLHFTSHRFFSTSLPLTFLVFALTGFLSACSSSSGGGVPGRAATPPVPGHFAATPGDGSVALSWDENSRADSFSISWTTDGATGLPGGGACPAASGTIDLDNPDGDLTATSHNGLCNGAMYTYDIVAENSGGASGIASAIATPMPVPAAPTIAAVAGDASVSLSWNEVDWAQSYNIYATTRDADDNIISSNELLVSGQVTTSFDHTDLPTGPKMEYFVRSANEVGESPDSNHSQREPHAYTKFVSAGSKHTCAIRSNGTLWCWGDNGSGQLGNGNRTRQKQAVMIEIPNDTANDNSVAWKSVTTGKSHTCGLKENGKLWCWGGNFYGQLGIGSNDIRLRQQTPARVGVASDWAGVYSGDWHSCAINTIGRLYCWGKNEQGQLGINSSGEGVDAITPQLLDGGSDGWVKVAGGESHTCGIRTTAPGENTMYCWGMDFNGRVGRGMDTAAQIFPIPTAVVTQTTTEDRNWQDVAAGDKHSCGIRETANGQRRVYCWGSNSWGQVGLNPDTTSRTFAPTPVGSLTDWVSLDGGFAYTCATRGATNLLFCWGRVSNGQLGAGVIGPSYLPQQFSTADDNEWTMVSAGLEHACAIKSNEKLWCWGYNDAGQLGDGTDGTIVTPTQINTSAADATGWTAVSVGSGSTQGDIEMGHVCARKNDGSIWCWGEGRFGTLGDGTVNSKDIPAPATGDFSVSNPASKSTLGAGWASTCAKVESMGQHLIKCWGNDNGGQVGDGSPAPDSIPDPTTIAGGFTDWQSMSTGATHACGIRGNGTLYCWGSDFNQQLGNSGPAITVNPQPVQETTGATNWESVAAGSSHSCAVRTDGSLWCWGNNNSGKLGDGTSTTRPEATREDSNANDWSSVATGDGQGTCAIKDNLSLWCWGSVYAPDGSSNVPQAVSISNATNTWQDITIGTSHACALHNNGTMWCWGANSAGQLGDGTYQSRSRSDAIKINTPDDQEAMIDSVWNSIDAGNNTTCGVKDDTTLWCWGSNTVGQTGNGNAWRDAPGVVPFP